VPQTTTVKQSDLMNYTYAMIRHAVYNHPDDVAHLLQSNGVSVPQNTDKPTLHIMTLTAMKNSDAFKPQLVDFLHNIAMEGQYKKYSGIEGNNYANQTGTPPSASTCCCCSWFAQTFNPKMVDTLLTAGVGLASKNLLNTGASGMQAATKPATPAPKKSNTGLIVGSILFVGLGVAGYLWWKSKKKGGGVSATT